MRSTALGEKHLSVNPAEWAPSSLLRTSIGTAACCARPGASASALRPPRGSARRRASGLAPRGPT
eukprot:4653895-Pyramimonas_sp.AAC.1